MDGTPRRSLRGASPHPYRDTNRSYGEFLKRHLRFWQPEVKPPHAPSGRPQPGWRAGQGTPVFTPAPRPGGQRNRVPPIVKKRGDGLERRPPAGIARERETSADDTAPCQCERLTPSQHRMPRSLPLPAAAPLSCQAGCAGGPDHGGFSRWGPAPARRRRANGAVLLSRWCRPGQGSPPGFAKCRVAPSVHRTKRPSRPSGRRGADRRSAFQAVPALSLFWRWEFRGLRPRCRPEVGVPSRPRAFAPLAMRGAGLKAVYLAGGAGQVGRQSLEESPLPVCSSRKGFTRSSGRGKMMVEFFSLAMSVSV